VETKVKSKVLKRYRGSQEPGKDGNGRSEPIYVWKVSIATLEVEFKVGTDGEILQTYEGRKGERYGFTWVEIVELGVSSDCQMSFSYITFNKWFGQKGLHPVPKSRFRFTKVLEQLERRL